jgi:hypothetical protein
VFVCPRSVEHTNEEWVLFFFKAFYFNEIVFKRGHGNKGKKRCSQQRAKSLLRSDDTAAIGSAQFYFR